MTDALVTIGRTEGIRGLYRGLGPTLVGLVPSWAIYFSTYSFLKTRVVKDGMLQQMLSLRDAAKGAAGDMRFALCSAIAGATTTISINPIWVLRTRLIVWIH